VSDNGTGEAVRRVRALALLDRYADELAAHAYKLGCTPTEAEDVADEAILALLSRKADAKTIENERAWLYAVTRRVAIKVLSANKRYDERLHGLDFRQRAWAEPEIALEAAETFRALAKLPVEHREAVVLAAQGFANAEIAEITEVSTDVVKQRVSRGRRRLRQLTGRAKPVEPSTISGRRSE
jgi:RNA polymerase sigma factor (sigma-70 family)